MINFMFESLGYRAWSCSTKGGDVGISDLVFSPDSITEAQI